jgi:hypothetical protein
LSTTKIRKNKMSIDRCAECSNYVDTDDDIDCYDNLKEICLCEICREKIIINNKGKVKND